MSPEQPTQPLKIGITVGPTPQEQYPVSVNTEIPTLIESPHFSGRVIIRMQNYTKHDTNSSEPSTTNYFSQKRRRFSIQVTGRFKSVHLGDDVWFGVVLDKPLVNLPMGTDLALHFAKMLDPAIHADLHALHPYSLSPLLCAVNVLEVVPVPEVGRVEVAEEGGGEVGNGEVVSPSVKDTQSTRSSTSWAQKGFLGRWKSKSSSSTSTSNSSITLRQADVSQDGVNSENNSTLTNSTSSSCSNERLWLPPSIIPDTQDPSTPFTNYVEEKNGLGHVSFKSSTQNLNIYSSRHLSSTDRRKLFLKEETRLHYTFHPNFVYSFDFFNKYLDLATGTLQFPPKLSLDLVKYWKSRPLRYLAQSKDGKKVFFCVQFEIL